MKVLLHLRKYKRRHDISNIRNIQRVDNFAYQETKYDCEVKNIMCIENSAYGDVKHSQECHSKQQYKADHDNNQNLENTDYEECVLHVDSEAEAVNLPAD